MNKTQRIQELVTLLNLASDAYYNSDKSIMEDVEFDKLFDELKQLEQQTGLILSNSPTVNVGFEVKSKLEKVEHKIPLRSLNKTKSYDEVKKFLGNKKGIAMLKGDGLTNELDYENSLFIEGSTRGNGEVGEVINHNVKTYIDTPMTIPHKQPAKVTGEAVIFLDDFEKINEKLSDEEKYKTSRNLVAGSVRQLDSKICAKRKVRFMAFNVLEAEGINFKTKTEQLEWLGEQGFYVIPYMTIDKDDVEITIERLKQCAEELRIPIDGIVITYDDLEYAKSLGETAHHPLHSLAMKFGDDEFETEYIRTEWQVSRSGLINPVGIFKSVNIDGADITKATLHNLDYFRNLGLGKGDTVTVIRANQVIPKITGNLTRSNTEIIPLICPICGSETKEKFMKTTSVLYCTSDKCPSRQIAQFSHFVSRNCMNIDGLSESSLEKFISKGFLKRLPDVYSLELHKKEITHMDGFGLKSYNNMINAIENSRQCKLENFLFSLGIPQVGLSTAKLIAKKFKTIQGFINAKNSEIMSIEGIGDVTTEEILQYRMNNTDLILDLINCVEFIEEEKKDISEVQDSPLKGAKVYPTGKFTLKKDELKIKLEELGATIASGYAKSLDYLICGGDTSKSGKVDKAIKDGVKIMSEEEMMQYLK